MFSTLAVVLPVFALIFAGWAARRAGVFGPNASTELNRFVVWLALPALLFDVVANARWSEIWRPGFVAVFGLSVSLVFAATVALRLRRSGPLADAAIDGLNAGYGNVAYIGFPLMLAALGPESATPTLIATLITVCVLFAVAVVLIEIGLQSEAHPGRLAAKVGAALIRNPIVVGAALGVLVQLSGFGVPAPVERVLKLLGGAASPCALVALGLFLGAEREAPRSDVRSASMLVGLKLILQPALAWALATAFHLPGPLTHAAVLLAAMPTGTGPFMLAEFYRREAGLTSTVVLTSTVISVATISAYLAWATLG